MFWHDGMGSGRNGVGSGVSNVWMYLLFQKKQMILVYLLDFIYGCKIIKMVYLKIKNTFRDEELIEGEDGERLIAILSQDCPASSGRPRSRLLFAQISD